MRVVSRTIRPPASTRQRQPGGTTTVVSVDFDDHGPRRRGAGRQRVAGEHVDGHEAGLLEVRGPRRGSGPAGLRQPARRARSSGVLAAHRRHAQVDAAGRPRRGSRGRRSCDAARGSRCASARSVARVDRLRRPPAPSARRPGADSGSRPARVTSQRASGTPARAQHRARLGLPWPRRRAAISAGSAAAQRARRTSARSRGARRWRPGRARRSRRGSAG